MRFGSAAGRDRPLSRPLLNAPQIAVLCLAFVCLPAGAETVHGRVIGVADGDTLTILDEAKAQHKVRLRGIDAPEKGQALGQRSKENLARTVFGRVVRAECPKRDRYGRHICTVWVQPPNCLSCGLTLDAGHAQLTRGLAWHFKRYEKEQAGEERIRYADAEIEARGRKAGLWEDQLPLAPWDWRAAEKTRTRR